VVFSYSTLICLFELAVEQENVYTGYTVLLVGGEDDDGAKRVGGWGAEGW
jgi:hypothetical protein